MKRKGFTLIELLAVIVILSVITLITVPMITSVIEESKKKALLSSVQGVLDATDYFTMSHDAGVHEFLFDRKHQGSTVKGESLEYKGKIDGEGKLYIDKEGNTSICISNDKYYAYKNYNSDILVGERNSGNCIIGFDALTNKYIAMLDNLDTKITSNTNEISDIKSNLNTLSSVVSNNTENINNLNSQLERLITSGLCKSIKFNVNTFDYNDKTNAIFDIFINCNDGDAFFGYVVQFYSESIEVFYVDSFGKWYKMYSK